MQSHLHLHRANHFLQGHGNLHVIATCFNPIRYLSRYTLYSDFVAMATAAGATVWVAELAFGERPSEVSECDDPYHLQFRTSAEVWHKEAMINAAVRRLPRDWQYVAWVDADVMFTNPQWVQETIQQLQHYQIVQMFVNAVDMCPANSILKRVSSFGAAAADGKVTTKVGDYYYANQHFHPGYAWACRRDAWDAMGGLLDVNIIGGGDYQMAQAIVGQGERTIPKGSSPGYRRHVMAWQSHAAALKRSIGPVPGTILHYWHGPKSKRGYIDRWKVLSDNKFDPLFDLKRDWQGLWQLAGNKPALRDGLMNYFRSRCEDSLEAA